MTREKYLKFDFHIQQGSLVQYRTNDIEETKQLTVESIISVEMGVGGIGGITIRTARGELVQFDENTRIIAVSNPLLPVDENGLISWELSRYAGRSR